MGTNLAGKLKTRIADLMAAKCAGEIPVGNPTEVDIGGSPGMKVMILSPHYLDFCSVHQHAPLNPAGQMEWNQVTRVKILHIAL
ncbi:MAG: hypothetical protein EOO18_11955 [Chryseobacterium sp.]|nr:MAG: hypothetical protein EOO18_11955 [Chryseobacterium sp.]